MRSVTVRYTSDATTASELTKKKVALSMMQISFLLGVTFLVAQQRSSTLGSPWTSSKASTIIQDNVDVQLVQPVHENGRHPRQATQPADVAMPANLHFRFLMGARQVDLQMGKNKKGVADFPLFVIEDGRIKRKELPRDDTFQLYSNQTTGSTFMVRKSDNRAKFILEGFFYDGLDQLHLTPDPSGALHRIHKQAREVDLRDDYINTIATEGVSTESTRAPVGIRSSTRLRRQGEGHHDHEIRLFMVADYQEYQNWWNYYQKNSTRTEIEMNNFYSFIANSINIRYRSISEIDPSFQVDIVVTGLLTVNSPMVSTWTEGNTLKPGSRYVDAYRALEDFGLWVRRRHVDLPMSDHWMLFTGYDIYTDRNPIVAGLARLSTMCSLSSVSIIEQDYTGSVGATAAHELGHSLGSLHDGEETDCLDEDNYVMSKKLRTPDNDSRASRPWQFSKCSVRAFKRFLSKVQCTSKSTQSQSLLETGLNPGQIFSADKQCSLALGNGSYFARRLQYREGYSTMCRRMYCSVPRVTGLYQAIFPMERTSCGDRKWCQRGRCESHVDAPSMADNCPQGDDPTAPCVLEDCPLYTPWTKIGFCCHLCRATQRNGAPNLINSILHLNVVKKVLSPLSNDQAIVESQTTAASFTAHQPTTTARKDLTPPTTRIYASLVNGGLDHRSTEPPTDHSTADHSTADHYSEPRNGNASTADVTAVNPDHPAPSYWSNDTSETTDSNRLVSDPGEAQHAAMMSSAVTATTSAIPSTARSVTMTTDVRTHDPEENSFSTQMQTNWSSSSGQTERPEFTVDSGSESVNGSRSGYNVTMEDNSTTRIYVANASDASVDRPVQTNVTVTSTGSSNPTPAGNVEDPAIDLPKTSLAWHLGLTPNNRTADPKQWDPEVSLNMIHRGVVSGLGPGGGGDESRADTFKQNLVAGIKDRLMEVAAHSSSNRSLTGSDVTSTALNGPLDNLSFDASSGIRIMVSSPSETNHISQAPFGQLAPVPHLMMTILWLAATTPLPESDVTHKSTHAVNFTKSVMALVPSSRFASSSSSSEAPHDKSSSSLSSKERLFYDKLKGGPPSSASSGAVHLGNAEVHGPDQSIGHLEGADQLRHGQDHLDVFSSSSVNGAALDDQNSPSGLPLWEVPSSIILPESLTGDETPSGKSRDSGYQARWWHDVLTPRNPHALEVMDYAVNWPAGDSPPLQSSDTHKSPLSVNQPTQELTERLGPIAHKVEIISFQPHLRRFFEELTSVDALSTSSQSGSLTTAEPDRQRFLPNCRFQCVFYRELTGPPSYTSGQFTDYFVRARSDSNQMTSSSQTELPSSIGNRGSSNTIPRLVVR